MKRVVILSILILIAITGFISADLVDDFRAQINRAASYGTDFEGNNIDYARFTTYLSSVEEDMNAILYTGGSSSLTQENLRDVLGEPELTNWIASEDGSTEIQTADSVFVWPEKLILDGKEIQLRLSVTPRQSRNSIVYEASISAIFKEGVTEDIIKENIQNVERLAKTYALSHDIQDGNQLARESVSTEKIFEKYFEQTHDKCFDVLSRILGSESLNDRKKIIVEGYNIYDNGEYEVNVILSFCEECTREKWNGLEGEMKKDGDRIKFFLENEPTSEQFSSFGDAEIKRRFIELNGEINGLISSEGYKEVYSRLREMEELNSYWNMMANQGSESAQTLSFVDRAQFFNSLFTGYKKNEVSYYTQEDFIKVLYTEFAEQGEEICTNKIDDNANGKVDCQEDLCTGQVCDTKIVTVQEENQTVEKEVQFYCIEGSCQEKREETKSQTDFVCGNGICEENETTTCAQDCNSCPTHNPIECSGQVIYKGKDANGCFLEPICVPNALSCSSISDCVQPLCGRSECINGFCIPTELTECSQPKCTDGVDKKSQKCGSGEEIVIEICSGGVWKKTGALCAVPIGGPLQQITIQKAGACTTIGDCNPGGQGDKICSNGLCVTPPSKQLSSSTSQKIFSKDQAFTAITTTGAVIKITGEQITASGITSAVGPDPFAEEFLAEPDTTTVAERIYEESEPPRSLLPGVRDLRDIDLPEDSPALNERIFASPTSSASKSGIIKEEFKINGACKTNQYETKSSIQFLSSGENFVFISDLQEKYNEKGPWCELKLREQLEKRKAIEQSFNLEFAEWFYNSIYNYAEDWETKKETLIKLYSEITENTREIAYNMDCLGVKTISDFDLINFNYKSDYGELIFEETLQKVQLPGMSRKVEVPYSSMQASLFLSKDFVKKQLKNKMKSLEFPSLSSQRNLEGGLSVEEKIAFRGDEEIRGKISQALNDVKDGYIDAQITFVDNSESGTEVVYNMYVRLNEQEFLLQPMPPENVPTALDVKITADYNAIYNLMYVSENNAKETLTLHPSWDQEKFRPLESIKLATNWIQLQSSISGMMSSLEVTPKRDWARDLFKESFKLIASN